jgi:hypothetical protein
MDAEQEADAIEAAARIMALGEPLPRAFVDLVNRVVEARGGWNGGQPVDGVIDAVFDEILSVANGHRRRLFASALSRAFRPATKH